MRNKLFTFLSLIFSLSCYGFDEGWNENSDPAILSQRFETRFYLLPKNGNLISRGNLWSGDYWPLSKGMIDYRWKDNNQIIQRELDFSVVQNLSIEDINLLSPAEKLDLLNGDYDFHLKKHVRKQIPATVDKWEGLCHGWAAASVHQSEPTKKTMTNPQGLQIPFDSSDIKALLSYYYAYQVEHEGFIGERCDGRNSNCTQDLNAGAFHIIISNFLAIDQRPIIADLQRFSEVWNHPIVGFKSKILKDWRGSERNSAPGTTRQVKIRNRLYYIAETKNNPNPVLGTSLQNEGFIDFTYTLDIDQYGLIIGGTWNSIQRPDFLWVPGKANQFEGKFYRLNELVKTESSYQTALRN